MSSIDRYSRQIPLIGVKGLKKLRRARIAIVGAGGLGSNVALQLALMGAGRLLLIDKDLITVDNLNRQPLYTPSDVGRPKVTVAKKRLEALNSDVTVEALYVEVNEENVDELLKGYDVVVDCLDNWRTRRILDRHIWSKGKILVHGAVNGYYGQVTTIKRGITTCLSCLSGEDLEEPPSIMPAVGLVASLQAMEVIKVVTELEKPLYNKLAIVDIKEPSISIVNIEPFDCGSCPSL